MPKKAILLMNLGSPDSPSVPDVRAYLREFLMDERVIDVPAWWRNILVKGIIVPFRSPKSAKAYRSIWTKDGSPLVVLTNQLSDAVAKETGLPVAVCMRYGNPTPQSAMDELLRTHPGLEEVVLFPLYPHYAMSSYETAVEYVKAIHQKRQYPFRLTVVPPYYRYELYITALAESIRPFLLEEYDMLLFSYHGIPERHIQKSDVTGKHCLSNKDCCAIASPAHPFCYRHQVIKTTELVASRLHLPQGKYALSFQSRLGRDEWLKPYTAERLESLPKEGVKKLLVVCPAFVSDCLETLEEIGEEGKHTFLKAGGEKFTMIPCLNIQPGWVKAVGEMARTEIRV